MTLDDLMHNVVEELLAQQDRVTTTKGSSTELTGVLLELSNPRARLSRTETRGKPISALGELCWYLAKSNDVEFIAYYVPKYRDYAEEGKIFGGYGPRLFNQRAVDQISNVIALLTDNPASRRAAIQLFDAADLEAYHKDIPCTCTLQFLVRHDELHMFTYMRSNDVYLGLPHDIFCFTMLQEIIARSLSVELGTYKHSASSLHLYDDDREAAAHFLNEGYQSTAAMPELPQGDPWEAIGRLLDAENKLRQGVAIDMSTLATLDPYWADLVRLLCMFRYSKDGDRQGIVKLRDEMASNIYSPFIEARLSQLL